MRTKKPIARALIPPEIKKEAFDLQIPNEKTIKAINSSRRGKGEKFTTSRELFDDLGI